MAILVVCGTGTGIGKTHVSCAILHRAGRGHAALGYKPVETGCAPDDPKSDFARLDGASSFHVKHPPEFLFGAPISPHLAARREGRAIDPARIVGRVRELAAPVDLLLVELAGGLFSPLGDDVTNADLLRDLQRDQPTARALLVAPDRLGVLHDVGATARAAAASGARLDGIVLSAPETPDASTGINEAELRLVTDLPVYGAFRRASAAELADDAATTSIYMLLLRF